MNNKYKIILNYINDLSVEVKDPEALLIARERANLKTYVRTNSPISGSSLNV